MYVCVCGTQANAIEKIGKFTYKIGYPDKWKDHSELKFLATDSSFELCQKVTEFELKAHTTLHVANFFWGGGGWRKEGEVRAFCCSQSEFFNKLNTRRDKGEWAMYPQQVGAQHASVDAHVFTCCRALWEQVNAYFSPQNNEIVFPAAILQPPFYHKHISEVTQPTPLDKTPLDGALLNEELLAVTLLDAINFGAIGAVIAHEITHGFDDQGRKFDKDGKIEDWWDTESEENFNKKKLLMKDQADKYDYTDTVTHKSHKMNSDLTMGENLADLGGVSLSLQALQLKLKECNVPTPLQTLHCKHFFQSWANLWKSKNTNTDIVKKLSTDPHAPPSFRCDLLKNIDQFYEVYEYKEGSRNFLSPEKRVCMW